MILLQGFGLVVTVSFLTYVASIIIPFLRHQPAATGDPSGYRWHVFVPCRDEEAVIGTTLHRLRASSPDAQVWVVDDASEDRTAQIVARMAEADAGIHLVRRHLPDARTGKGHALNAAYRALDAWLPVDEDRSTAIVCVLDADGVMGSDTWDYTSGPEGFADPAVGAVQISVRMINVDDPEPCRSGQWLANRCARLLVRMQDLEFRTTIAAMQLLRTRCESVGLGGNGQFTRLSMLDQLAEAAGTPWHGALLEDYELGIHALLAGWKVRYIHEAHVDQEGLTNLRRLVRQRSRWAQGNMQCSRYLPHILASSNFTLAGALEASYFLVLPFVQVAGVIVWPILLGVLIHQASAFPGGIPAWVAEYWELPLLTFTLGIAPFVIFGPIYRRRCQPQASWATGIGWGFANWLYVFYMYVCNANAFYRLIRGETGWAKTRRNAESGPEPSSAASVSPPAILRPAYRGGIGCDPVVVRPRPSATGLAMAQALLLCRSRALVLGARPRDLESLTGSLDGSADLVCALTSLAENSPRLVLDLATRAHRATPARVPDAHALALCGQAAGPR